MSSSDASVTVTPANSLRSARAMRSAKSSGRPCSLRRRPECQRRRHRFAMSRRRDWPSSSVEHHRKRSGLIVVEATHTEKGTELAQRESDSTIRPTLIGGGRLSRADNATGPDLVEEGDDRLRRVESSPVTRDGDIVGSRWLQVCEQTVQLLSFVRPLQPHGRGIPTRSVDPSRCRTGRRYTVIPEMPASDPLAGAADPLSA